MTSFLPRLVGIGSVRLIIRSFHRSCTLDAIQSGSYEGDGKTTISILNKDLDYGLMIDGLSKAGFKLNIGIWVLGPMIVFPRSVIGWNIGSSEEINEDSLTLLKVLEPTPDILIVGLDQKYDNETPFIKTLKAFAKRLKLNIEILQTEHACTTFNFLNAEKRFVVAALMPPRIQLPKEIKAIQDITMRRSLAKAEKHIDSE